MRALIPAIALVAMVAPVRAAETPAAAAQDFYAVYGPVHVIGGGLPDAKQRARYAPVLSPQLNQKIALAAAAQDRMTAKVKNAVPPVLQGDLFSSVFEGATGWKIGGCTDNGKTARCPVTLVNEVKTGPGEKPVKPVNWNDTLLLVNTAQGWKVDDVIYDGNFAFGNTGRLTTMLAMVLSVEK